ncbi:sigma-70 domain-containing protein [Sorangium sp. So ce1151]|uniref:sigma-70 domain-containing protein n=1 Tax=Sorangium sp. So ce1151 TaxID=3133332 RepID=UPI003F63450E
MQPVIDDMIQELLTRHRASGRVDLNDIAEVIGGRPVSYEEVEHIIDRLESEGLRVAEPLDAVDVEVLRAVLASARRLAGELGRRPTIGEIALACGHAPHAVRRALEQAGRVKAC